MKSIIKILKSPLINVRGLEKKIECPESTLHQAVKGHKSLPKKWLWPICIELSRTGIMIEGWRVSSDGLTLAFIKDRNVDADVYEHREYESGEVKTFLIGPEDFEEHDADGALRSWFEYKQPQTKKLITEENELIQFLNSL